jgi:hypothetical protein
MTQLAANSFGLLACDSKDRTLTHWTGAAHGRFAASYGLNIDSLKNRRRNPAHQRPEQQQECDAVEAATPMGRSNVAVARIKSKRV